MFPQTRLHTLSVFPLFFFSFSIQYISLSLSLYRFFELTIFSPSHAKQLQHPVVNALEGTEFGWLSKLLAAFNSGDIAGYQAIAANKPAEVLVKNAALLNQKIRIMALMDMVFSRSSDDRIIDFGEIAEQCQLDANEVELLLMKAFSLKVLKGKIDQVNSNVLFTWVQPRVLNQTQIAGLADRLAAWSDKVNETALLIEGNASEILTSGGF